MFCIYIDSQDIYYNLALEEYLLKHKQDEYVLVWSSECSVVVGKHQNTWAEINYPFLRVRKIPVARRLSGGGTVYHGPGNLNFTFIMNGAKGKMVDFKRFISPIIKFLRQKGLPAIMGDRNDILVNGMKISGNAEHVFKTRVLHHGTLLYNADLNFLKESIRTNPSRYIHKSVPSIRSEVINVSSLLKTSISFEDFSKDLYYFILKEYNKWQPDRLIPEDMQEILKLVREKYSRWEWIYGYSPEFQFQNTVPFQGGEILIQLMVQRGIIKKSFFSGTGQNPFWIWISKQLPSHRYDYDEISNLMNSFLTHEHHKTFLLENLF